PLRHGGFHLSPAGGLQPHRAGRRSHLPVFGGDREAVSEESRPAGARMRTAVLLLAIAASPVLAADPGHGKALFEACMACHTERPDAVGPSLKGVVGRKSGSIGDYRYSNPM